MTNDIQISEREREILELVVTGATNQQIALQLDISINTVKVHLRNIFNKIGVVSRTEATTYALRHGLVTLHGEAQHNLVATLPAPAEAPAVSQPEPDEPSFTSLATPESQPSDSEAPAPPLPLVQPVVPPASVDATTPPTQELPSPMPKSSPKRDFSTEVRAWLPFVIIFVLVALVFVALPLLRQTPAAPSGVALTPNNEVIASTASSRWIARSPLPNPRDHFALAAFDLQQEIYLFGGSDANGVSGSIERYDPTNDLWTSLGEKPTPVQHASAVTLRGQIFLPGGEDAEGQVLTTLEIYDPRERSWSTGPDLPAPRSRYTLVAWDGQIYLIGGWDGSETRGEVFIFDPDANRWLEGPALPAPRQHAGAIIVSGRLYLIGGEGANGPLREGLRLDPGDHSARRWISIAPLPTAIAAPAVVAPAGMLLVFDPSQGSGLQYNQTSDVWQPLTIPDDATLASSVVMLDTQVYFVAGTAAPQPGAVSQYQTVFTIFLP
ncbi:MAG: LuxR family transcriptional regulator [Candidatus Viridilinea halotolerans]|uniref:LuxR family transcriptional regulator n=1 Tax=Candidatus Viridilinea halotolerans TaxID=2491704 RepID=A0A426TUH9_9CHLR|nr:MAG: LuxR family transcriptional regulator [Candidatus Viridilinea halotolerans]